MTNALFTAQFLIFDTLISLAIVISCFLVFIRTRELFKLSYQKGINFFSKAFLFYTICFIMVYINNLVYNFYQDANMPLLMLLGFFTIYTAGMGGVYLAYSLMWRKFEKDRIKRFHPGKALMANIVVIFIALIEIYLSIVFNLKVPYLFFGIMITMLFVAISFSHKQHEEAKKHGHPDNSDTAFLYSAGLGFIIYIALFLGSLLISILPTIHYYVWGIVTVFFVTVANNVIKLTK